MNLIKLNLLRTALLRLNQARFSLIATALVLLTIIIVAPNLVWLCFAGFLIIVLATLFNLRQRNTRNLRQMVERRQQRTWPRNAMKSIVEALDQPVFILDRSGILRYANEASSYHFGPTNVGDPLSFKFRDPQINEMVTDAITTNRSREMVFEEQSAAGRWYNLECSPVPKIRNRQRLDEPSKFFLLSFNDVTTSYKSEQMRSDFVANASHELRTPLASLRGFIETLQGPAKNDAKARQKFLDIMLAQAERMSRLIEDLLSLSRIEMKAHVAPDETVDLAAILAQVKTSTLETAKQYGCRLRFTGLQAPLMIVGDSDELIQVFENLVENACKYGQKNGSVTLKLHRDETPPRVSVHDKGSGIGEHHIARLTERFYRVDSGEEPVAKGTGLGLAIVKHIIARHRGELLIDSVQGKGTIVSVLFSEK